MGGTDGILNVGREDLDIPLTYGQLTTLDQILLASLQRIRRIEIFLGIGSFEDLERRKDEVFAVQGAYVIPYGTTLEKMKETVFRECLVRNKGNRTKTAAELGVNLKTLYNYLKKWGE